MAAYFKGGEVGRRCQGCLESIKRKKRSPNTLEMRSFGFRLKLLSDVNFRVTRVQPTELRDEGQVEVKLLHQPVHRGPGTLREDLGVWWRWGVGVSARVVRDLEGKSDAARRLGISQSRRFAVLT